MGMQLGGAVKGKSVAAAAKLVIFHGIDDLLYIKIFISLCRISKAFSVSLIAYFLSIG